MNSTPISLTSEDTQLLRALLSNAVLMREALERLDKRVDRLSCEVSDICTDIAAMNLFD